MTIRNSVAISALSLALIGTPASSENAPPLRAHGNPSEVTKNTQQQYAWILMQQQQQQYIGLLEQQRLKNNPLLQQHTHRTPAIVNNISSPCLNTPIYTPDRKLLGLSLKNREDIDGALIVGYSSELMNTKDAKAFYEGDIIMGINGVRVHSAEEVVRCFHGIVRSPGSVTIDGNNIATGKQWKVTIPINNFFRN